MRETKCANRKAEVGSKPGEERKTAGKRVERKGEKSGIMNENKL